MKPVTVETNFYALIKKKKIPLISFIFLKGKTPEISRVAVKFS